VAPSVFEEGEGRSFVAAQPRSPEDRRRAFMALVACPTASIGTSPNADASEGVRAFPEPIDENVSFCGFTSESSFGAWSYLIERPEGNVLVDSPRAAGPLLSALEARGGVATMFLTHRDDVADHAALRRRFGCERVIHEDDVTAGTQGVERRLTGLDPTTLDEDLVAIPTPGHTRGHAVLLYRNRYLFTGDHLAWSRRRGHLVAFREANWYSWPETIRSMERLLDYSFEWVLPGHGERYRAVSAAAMRRELERCVAWMKKR
jgi:glyoxylase-like metal-dependent hydrolase (beta-lactamase superfamily II)